MITGTHTLCWKCGQEFIMGDHSPLKPTCEDCRTKNTRITPEINVKELVDKLLGKI